MYCGVQLTGSTNEYPMTLFFCLKYFSFTTDVHKTSRTPWGGWGELHRGAGGSTSGSRRCGGTTLRRRDLLRRCRRRPVHLCPPYWREALHLWAVWEEFQSTEPVGRDISWFNQSSDLKWHHMVHTGEKPITCEQRGRSFRLRGSFWNHQHICAGH